MINAVTNDSSVEKGIPEPHEGIKFQETNVKESKILSGKVAEASNVKSCAEVISSSRQGYHLLSCSSGESDRDNDPRKSFEAHVSWRDRALQLEKLLLLSYEEIARYGGEADALTHGLSRLSGVQRSTSTTLEESTIRLKVDDDQIKENPSASISPQMSRQSLADTIHRILYREKAEKTTQFNGIGGSSRFTSLSPNDEAYLAMGCDASFPFQEVNEPPLLPLSTFRREEERKTEEHTLPFFSPPHPIIVLDISSMFSCASLISQRKTKALPIESHNINTISGNEKDVLRDPAYLLATSKENSKNNARTVIPKVMHFRAENLNANCAKSCRKGKGRTSSTASVESIAHGVCFIKPQVSDDGDNSKHVISTSPLREKKEEVILTTARCATTTQRAVQRKDSAVLREKSEKQLCKSSSRVECGFPAVASGIFTSDLQSVTAKEMLPGNTDQPAEKEKEKADFNDATSMVSTHYSGIDNKKAPEFSSFLCRSTDLSTELPPSPSFPPEDMKVEQKVSPAIVSEKTVEMYEREIERLRRENSLLKYRERRRISEGKGTQDVPGTVVESRYLTRTRNCVPTVHEGADRPLLKTFCESYIPISDFDASKELSSVSCAITPNVCPAVGVPGSGITSSSPPSPSFSPHSSREEMRTGTEEFTDSFSPINKWELSSDKESELRRLRILMRFSYLKKDSDELEVIKKQLQSVQAAYQYLQFEEEKSREGIKKMLRDMTDIQRILSSALSICYQKNSCSSSHQLRSTNDVSRKSEEIFLIERAIAMCKSFNSYSNSEAPSTDIGGTTNNTSCLECDTAPHRLCSHSDLFNSEQEGKTSALGEPSECRHPSACVPSTNEASPPLSFPFTPFRFHEKPPMPEQTAIAHRKGSTSFSLRAASSSRHLRSGSTTSFYSSFPRTGKTVAEKTAALEGSRKRRDKNAETRWTSQSAFHQIARDAAYQCCNSGDKGDNTGSESVPRIQQAMDDARALANVLHKCQFSTSQQKTTVSTKRYPSKS